MWEVVSKMALRKMEGPAIPRWMQRVPLRQAGMPGNISSPTRDLAVCGGCHREVQRPKIAIFRDKKNPVCQLLGVHLSSSIFVFRRSNKM
jgi:hypothetical protein